VDACLDTSGPLVLRGLGRWLVNDLADDVLSEQDRISLVITVRTMKEETEKWQSASCEGRAGIIHFKERTDA
jgi:hypothetical protein